MFTAQEGKKTGKKNHSGKKIPYIPKVNFPRTKNIKTKKHKFRDEMTKL